MEKTFLLGVGAQKAGTTWLYRYLKQHPDCNMGSIKEYAVFNTVLRPDLFHKRPRNRFRSLARICEARAELPQDHYAYEDPAALLELMDSIALAADPERYVPHFDRLYDAAPQVRLVGDITPEYSALRAEDYRFIRNLIEAGGYRIKVVFLMRDPLERCYSATRMADRSASRQGQKVRKAAHERFATEAVSQWCDIRTRYEHTITALEESFAPEDVFHGFYETLLSQEGVRALTDFLGIAPHPANLDRRVNASPRTHEPDPAAIAAVRRHYAETYDFCRHRFGARFIDRIWRYAEHDGQGEGKK